jgi:DNA-binding PadR family transcriptional regulator
VSETNLIEALKRLEANGIIEVEKRSARTNRYRIRGVGKLILVSLTDREGGFTSFTRAENEELACGN